jgi:hypothetical protein
LGCSATENDDDDNDDDNNNNNNNNNNMSIFFIRSAVLDVGSVFILIDEAKILK